MFNLQLSVHNARLTIAILLLTSQAVLAACGNAWVDIWGSMPQLTEPANLPPAPYNQTGVVFQNATIRQTVRIGLDAPTIRLQISNAFGGSDLPITAVTIALPSNGSAGTASIDPTTLKTVTFSGSPNFTIPNGALAVSDPIPFPVKALSILTVSIFLATGQTTNSITSHPGSRTTSFFAPGNQVSTADLGTDPALARADHWYFLSTISGWVPAASRALPIVGDSISDGRGSTTNQNDRWPDILQNRLLGAKAIPPVPRVAVINQAAGGNRVLADGLGPNALGRLDRDVLAHEGVGYVLVFEGVNDIGTAAVDAGAQGAVGGRLIAALEQMVVRLHGRGVAVFGATITPFGGVNQTYSDPERERTRQRVNAWIRDSGRFDAVVDFDAVVRDPANVTQLRAEFDTGDHLHLNPAGYRAMAESIDLGIFSTFAGGVHSMT